MKDKCTYHIFDAAGNLSDAMRVNPYTVPAGYFDDLQQLILQRGRHIEDAQASFTVPSDYFNQLQEDITVKISESALKVRVSDPGFSVPEGYFGNLEKNTLERIKFIDGHSAPAMATPPDYFQQLQEDILAKVAEQQLSARVNGESGFSVPDGYFDALTHRVADRTTHRQTTPVRRISQPRWMTYAAAACIALAVSVVGFFKLNHDEEVVQTSHLASVSDQEILSYLELYGTENDIVYISEHIDDFGERGIGDGLSDEDIEAYLNNTL